MAKTTKRRYTHRKGLVMPMQHGSTLDEIDHDFSPDLGRYKTPKKKKKFSFS